MWFSSFWMQIRKDGPKEYFCHWTFQKNNKQKTKHSCIIVRDTSNWYLSTTKNWSIFAKPVGQQYGESDCVFRWMHHSCDHCSDRILQPGNRTRPECLSVYCWVCCGGASLTEKRFLKNFLLSACTKSSHRKGAPGTTKF